MRGKHGCLMAGLLVAVLFVWTDSLPAAGKEYSLPELLQVAVEAERIKLAEEQVNISRWGSEKAKAALMPRFSASVGATRFTEKKYSSPPVATLIQPETAAAWGLRLEQGISLGGREFINRNISEENVIKSKYDLQSVKEEYFLQVALVYFEVLKAQRTLEIAGTNLERLTKHRDATSKRVKLGELTRTVLLRAEGELSGALSDFVRAKNYLEMARNQLIRLTGLDKDFRLKEPVFALLELPPKEEAKEKAIAQRSEIKSLEQQIKMSAEQVRLAKASYWPNLSVAVSYAGLDQNPAAATINRESISGSVTISYPLFDGGLRKAEVSEARIRERQLDLSLKDLKKNINNEVEGIYLDILTLRGILDFHQNQLTFAQDNFQAISRQFEVGLANSIDVMDANSLLVSSERRLMETRYNYQFYLLKWKRVMGISLQEAR